MMLALMVFNYANNVRWQIRAQNATDAVAQGIVSVQTQHYNEMMATLHSAGIEEYRIRRTLAGLLYVLQGSGGCTASGATSNTTPFDCAIAYNNLRTNYVAQVARYTQLVNQMQAISQYTPAQQQTDMAAIAHSFETTCTSSGPTGGDCVFKFAISTPTARPGLSGAIVDSSGEINGDGYPLPANIAADFQPLQLEVTACAQVTSPFNSFFKMNAQPFYAIGRAGATSAMVTQEWFNPGIQTNPNSPGATQAFQQPEFPESSTNTSNAIMGFNSTNFCNATSGQYDWYAVHWCQNNYLSVFTTPTPGGNGNPSLGGFQGHITTDEYSVWTGWWSALPLAPYTGTFTPSAANCASSVAWNTP
jgi:hypothetical protein